MIEQIEGSWANVLVEAAQQMSDAIESIAERLALMESECEAIAAETYYDKGVLHYRAGRYAYVYLSGSRGEGRRRIYVGADAQKIEEAERAIARGEALRARRQEREQLERAASRWADKVARAVAAAPCNHGGMEGS